VKSEPIIIDEQLREECSPINTYPTTIKSETRNIGEWPSLRVSPKVHYPPPDMASMQSQVHHNSPISHRRKTVTHSSQVFIGNVTNPSCSSMRDDRYGKYDATHVITPPRSFDTDLASSLQHIASTSVTDDGGIRSQDGSLPFVVYYNQLSEDENTLRSRNNRKISRPARFEQVSGDYQS